MANESFVPIAENDLALYRRHDAEGDFFRELVAPIPVPFRGDLSRQGIYCLSAGGQLLAFKRNLSNFDAPALLQRGLRAFFRLPVEERQPGRVRVASLVPDPRADPAPPKGGLILRLYTRRLSVQDGVLQPSTSPLTAHGLQFAPEPQVDHMWLTRDECEAMVPRPVRPGVRAAMPDSVARRLCVYHLVDTTWEGSSHWNPEQIQSRSFTLRVDAVKRSEAQISVIGHAIMGNTRLHMVATLKGRLCYDFRRRIFTRFNMVALASLTGPDARTPLLGVAFGLTAGRSGADRIPPHDGLLLQQWTGVSGRPAARNVEPAADLTGFDTSRGNRW